MFKNKHLYFKWNKKNHLKEKIPEKSRRCLRMPEIMRIKWKWWKNKVNGNKVAHRRWRVSLCSTSCQPHANLGIRLILNNLLRFDHRFLFPDPADDPSWRVRDILPWAQFPQEAFKAAERGCQLINVLSCLADLCVEGLHFGLHKHSSCFLL